MLAISNMTRGAERQFLRSVARSTADVRCGLGEAPGRWIGCGAEQLALRGRVHGPALSAVLAGNHPHTGEPLTARKSARKVPGFELTLRAPKSVSLLWALADMPTAMQVQGAHDTAVAAAIDHVDRSVICSRRGKAGAERVAVDGLIAAAFRRRISLAGDPLLRTHVLVVNLARTTDDGVWRTLYSRRLYYHAKATGIVYQEHLRRELSGTLAVTWEPVVNGLADLTGVERRWIDAFSKRRQAILAHRRARDAGTDEPAVPAAPSQLASGPYRDVRSRWQAEAAAAGMDADWWRPLIRDAKSLAPSGRDVG